MPCQELEGMVKSTQAKVKLSNAYPSDTFGRGSRKIARTMLRTAKSVNRLDSKLCVIVGKRLKTNQPTLLFREIP
jgi:hypothetical protein